MLIRVIVGHHGLCCYVVWASFVFVVLRQSPLHGTSLCLPKIFCQNPSGPYLPPKSCNIGEQNGRYVDFCNKVSPRTSSKDGAEGLGGAARVRGGAVVALVLLGAVMSV